MVGEPLDFNSWPGIKHEHLNFGQAVAIVDLKWCKKTEDLTLGEIGNDKHFGDFSPGRYAWKMELIEVIVPFPVKGRQRIFEVEMAW